eukprot:5740317-Prymnesium_polylepis.1
MRDPVAWHVCLVAAHVLPAVLDHRAAEGRVVPARFIAALLLRCHELSEQQQQHGTTQCVRG